MTCEAIADGQPLVSVVIPAFNAAATLAETLLSAAAQTYRHIEIVIVDDGSTDRTREIAAVFCEKDPRARLVPVSHGGVGAARNRGIAAARGEFVAFLDADDLWSPEKIRKQVAKALPPGNVGFVYTFYRRIGDRGQPLGAPTQFAIEGRAFWRHLYWNFVGSGSSMLARRSLVLDMGGFDEGLESCEDYLLQLRLARRYPIACVPEYLVFYRDRPSSVSSDRERMFRGWREAVGRLGAADGRPGKRVAAWTYSRACWGLAISSLRRGKPVKAAHLLLWALAADPSRTFLNAKRVAARSFGRRLRAAGEPVIYDLDLARMNQLAARDAGTAVVDPD
ncbi:MAG TPA: glycosyltransferase family 2 protein [Allosphingosinicella sp.]|jgi:glycosyltransferase involved in cell wall biosynthesis